jgi:hypothetical protein
VVVEDGMSSVIELAEIKRLQKAYNEQRQAEHWHKAEATRISYALMAARVRLKKAQDAEVAEAQE